jgi:hypothetical protein
MEGIKQKLSKEEGQKSLIKRISKFSFLVSWMQITSHWLSFTLFFRDSHLFSAFKPLIFQHRTFQDLLILVEFIGNTEKKAKARHTYV